MTFPNLRILPFFALFCFGVIAGCQDAPPSPETNSNEPAESAATHSETRDDATAVSASETSDSLQLLAQFADGMRSNVERIQTWSGTCRFSDRVRQSGGDDALRSPSEDTGADPVRHAAWKLETGTIDFDFDRSGPYVTSWVHADGPPELEDVDTGERLAGSFGVFEQLSILTPDSFVEYRPNRAIQYGDPGPSGERASGDLVTRYEPEKGSDGRDFGHVFHPLDLYNIGQHDLMMHERFARYVTVAERGVEDRERVLNHLSISEIDDGTFVLQVWYRQGNDPGITGRWTIQESLGFHAVQFQKLVGRPNVNDDAAPVLERRAWEYTEQEDIRLPSVVQQQLFDQDGQLEFERAIEFVDSTLNQPVDESAFAIESLPLKDGDRVNDLIAGSEQVSLDGRLIPLNEYLQRTGN